MKVQLPLVFDVAVDEAAVQDLQIDFGVAEARHLRGVDWSDGFPSVSVETMNAFTAKLQAREALWRLLERGITLPPDVPARLRPLVCACALCQLFGVTAQIDSAKLGETGTDARWDVEIGLLDKQGKLLKNWSTISEAFRPDGPDAYHKSLAAFFGAAVDAIRECALSAFLASEARDDQDAR